MNEEEECCYWKEENFWISFIEEELDHYWMLSVFQTIFGEEECRTKLLSHLIFKRNYFGLEIPAIHGNCYCLNEIKSLVKKAKKEQTIAFITYIYKRTSNFKNAEDELLVHYVMIVFNPKSKTSYYIDPRGLVENSLFHTNIWKEEYRNICALFKNYHWINVITTDLQTLSPSDTFCRTWSLMVTYYLVCDRVNIHNATQFFSQNPLKHICSFLKECIYNSNEFKEAVYFEVYAKTHQNDINPFPKIYHPYFTKLEEKASTFGFYFYDRDKKNLLVGKMYDFVEEFVDYIDENALISMMIK